MDLNTAVSSLRELDQADTSDFWPLAKWLVEIKSEDPKMLRKAVDAADIKPRRAFMLIRIHEVFSSTRFKEDDLLSIGWAKLYAISKPVSENPDNADYFLKLARDCTSRELTLKLNGLEVARKTHSVLLALPDTTYDKLRRALLRYGAIPAGRGLAQKEEALEALLDRLEAIDAGTPRVVQMLSK